MELEQAIDVLARRQEEQEAEEVIARADRLADAEKRKAGIAKQRASERAKTERFLEACLPFKEAIDALGPDVQYRCDAAGLSITIDRAILGAQKRVALLDGDEERVKEIKRKRSALRAGDPLTHPRNVL
jgi:hypothetical protein